MVVPLGGWHKLLAKLSGLFGPLEDAGAGLARQAGPRPSLFSRPLVRFLITVAGLAASLALLLNAIPKMSRQWGAVPYDGFIDWGGAKEMLAGHDPYSEPSL